uniref:L1 transposable element RRM domain-containing protein n=1 Tax=Molossus molossus TaxID=27622 RepID=A0A7J8JWP0_MOLMO|nr:hypothetical protein HJG59_007833 [Molossus molossus]
MFLSLSLSLFLSLPPTLPEQKMEKCPWVRIKKIKIKINNNNNLHRFSSRVGKAKKQTIDLEYKEAKNTQSEEQKEKRIQKNEDSVRSLWDNFKHANIHILGVPVGEEREQEIENLFETIMAENVPNLIKETDIQVEEAQSVPNKMNPKRPTPSHIIIKMRKVQDKESLKSSKRKPVSYLQGSSH